MSTPYIGQISMFGGNFAPINWAFCNGQLLAITQYQALFAVLGTTYGGNGTTTFALPNLISRLPVGQGTGAGLSTYVLGQNAGAATVTITTQTMPAHTHALNASQGQANTGTIGPTVVAAVANGPTPAALYATTSTSPPPLLAMSPAVCSNAGGNQPHTNLMPSLCITFIIALQGIFPTRS